eukprot:2358589-Pleurochrysis_carterae.AAC.2
MAPSLEQQFAQFTDLADERLNAKILFATDEWFAPAQMLLQAAPPHFDPNAFCEQVTCRSQTEFRRMLLDTCAACWLYLHRLWDLIQYEAALIGLSESCQYCVPGR